MANDKAARAPTPQPETAGGNENQSDEVIEREQETLGTVTDEVATAPGQTTSSQEEPGEQPRGHKAVDVEDYERRLREALSPAPVNPQEESADGPETDEEESPTGEGETAEAEAEPETVEAEAESEDDDEKAPDRVRISRLKDASDKRRVATATKLAGDEGISFDEAWTRVTGKTTSAPQSETETTTAPVRTQTEIDADIQSKKEEKRKAATDLDTVKMLDLEEEIETLKIELANVKTAERETAQATQTKFQSDAAESARQAVRFYPDSAKEGTPLRTEILAIADLWERTKDPALHQADAALVAAQMAAKKLRIAPVDPDKAKTVAQSAAKPSTSTAAKAPAPVNQVAVGRSNQPAASPASGAARTNGNGQVSPAIEPIKTILDYERAREAVTGKRF